MKKNRKLSLLVVIVLILSMSTIMLSGCGTKQTSQQSQPANVTREKIVRFSMANTPKLDPAVGADTSSTVTFANIYDTLVFPDYDGSIKENVATKWDISNDGLTYTFQLRNGVKFHNGDELIADDVVFSMERLLEIKQGFAYLFDGKIKSVTAPDKYTVKFELNNVFGPFLSSLIHFSILNKKQVMANLQPGTYGDKQDYGKAWLLSHDAGSGPYMVKELGVNQYLLADRFKDYWGGFKPNNPDQFKLIGTTEPVTIRTMMSRKELEITDEYQPMENYDTLSKISGIELASFPSGKVMMVQMNTTKTPADDVHFRKALAYAIDYKALSDLVGSKIAVGPISAELPGSNTDIAPLKQDLEKAKAELAQSKYANNIAQYPFELACNSETPDREKIALSVQAEAAKIGIKVNVIKVPWNTLVAQVTKPETTPTGFICPLLPDYPEAGAILAAGFYSKAEGTTRNLSWEKNPPTDKFIEEAMATLDTKVRFEKYKGIQEKIMDSMPVVPIYGVLERHAYQSSYLKWEQVELIKAGKPVAPNQGYMLYMRSIEFKE